MDLFPSFFEWWHLPLLFLAGLVGESFGALVGGGSIVTMPALLLTGVPIQTAIAVDNAASLGTEAGIAAEARSKIAKNKKMVLLMALPLTLGGAIGTWLLLTVPGDVIKYLMAATVVLMIIEAQFSKRPPRSISTSRYELVIGFLFLVGIYSNFMTAGEGAFSRVGLMIILGWSFIMSQGIQAAAIMPSRIYLLIVTGITGLIVWPYLLTMWCSNFIAGKYSTRFARRIPDKYMRLTLTIVSILFVIYLLFFY